MEKIKIKKIVAEQVSNMIENNIVCDCGYESFIGWLENGDVFINDGYSEEETDEIMAYVREVADDIDALVWKLSPENDGLLG